MAGRRQTWKPPKLRKARKKSFRELNIENAEKNWETLSEGLTPKEKLFLAKSLRGVGKMPAPLKARLFRQPSEDDLKSLALFCSRAIVNMTAAKRSDRVMANIRLPFMFRSHLPDFPSGNIVDVDLFTITFRMNVGNVLDWLWKKGYSTFSARMLRKHIGTFNKMLTEWENEFRILNEYGYDSNILDGWANLLDDIEGEKDE